eukprot:CAMPEP_0197889288 /NCGR_PEP_ID=MMETSP1439-20131203/24177_1 /TAXON_ID=66791 /ORGANISM="Gonyaulax spinifera, Strain CCMP409" /LENGTH=140 /DNA_ID=CAMNT_0043509259 /DNA_START=49 /DNA_END=468 /DNA_ORIENTATION=-
MPSRNLLDSDGYIQTEKACLAGHSHRTMVSGGSAHQRNTTAQYFVEEGHKVTVVESSRHLDKHLAQTNAVVHHIDNNFEKDPIIRKIKLEEKIGRQDAVVDFGKYVSPKEQGRLAYALSRKAEARSGGLTARQRQRRRRG